LGSLELAIGDIEPDWNSSDGLMTALFGEPPGASGLEISLNNGSFVDAYKETSLSVLLVEPPQFSPALISLLTRQNLLNDSRVTFPEGNEDTYR
jgi:hypothetical protein